MRSRCGGGNAHAGGPIKKILADHVMLPLPPTHTRAQVTFTDERSRTERSERVTSEAEARRLGFYLFWNLKSDFDS